MQHDSKSLAAPLHDRLAYSLADASKAVGIPKRTLHDALSRGEFPAVRRCGRWMVKRADLVRWLEDADK